MSVMRLYVGTGSEWQFCGVPECTAVHKDNDLPGKHEVRVSERASE